MPDIKIIIISTWNLSIYCFITESFDIVKQLDSRLAIEIGVLDLEAIALVFIFKQLKKYIYILS